MVGADVDLSPGSVAEARAVVDRFAFRTPVLDAEWIKPDQHTPVKLKAECLQATGSFKVRGVSLRLAGPPEALRAGVVTGSAGNHAKALAYVAAAQRIPCQIYMPATASRTKATAVREHGAVLAFRNEPVDRCLEHARGFAVEHGATMIHPFDDPLIIRGQATLGPELLEQVPDLATVIVPIGGGGLAAGIAGALKNVDDRIRVVGVQAEICAPLADPEMPQPDARFALADGIAIKHPGKLTTPLIGRYVDELCTVPEDAIAEAIVDLLQFGKLVVEGAGAVTVAALQTGLVEPSRSGATVAVLSGGNIDLGQLSAASRLHEASQETVVHIGTRVPDHPGGLAPLINAIAEAQANVVSVEHVRDAGRRGFHETGIELILQTRGPDHRDVLIQSLVDRGYEIVALTRPANGAYPGNADV